MKQAVCILVVNSDNHVLCVSRKDDLADWGLPGGKCDDGESVIETAKRETLEETGFSINILSPNYFERQCGEYNVLTFKAELTGISSTSIKENETGLVEFREISDLLSGSFGEYNDHCLRYFGMLGSNKIMSIPIDTYGHIFDVNYGDLEID